MLTLCFCVDCPLTDSEGGQLLSNGEEKLAERMVKDFEPRKSLGELQGERRGRADWILKLDVVA